MSNVLDAAKAIRIAIAHQNKGTMTSSAKSCLLDAVACFDARRFEYAIGHALRSLSYSVGILHSDHATVKAMCAK